MSEEREPVRDVVSGEGWSAASLDGLGEGPGFRKVRHALGVTAFGVNAVVLPPRWETGPHFHDEQEELYFVHAGVVEMEFGDGGVVRLEPGSLVRVDPGTVRRSRNLSDHEAVLLVAGGKDGYVGRDGRLPEGAERAGGALGPPGAHGGGPVG